MKFLKYLSACIVTVLCVACKNHSKPKAHTIAPSDSIVNASEKKHLEEKETAILLGVQTKDSLQKTPYKGWFDTAYKDYSLSEAIIKELQPLLGDVQIKVFMGTWCEDSQREVPAFYKILEASGYDFQNLTLITVSREKDTPQGLEKGLDIQYVPTFLFYKAQKEVGRIVESTKESLEKDMHTILSGQPYQHTYVE